MERLGNLLEIVIGLAVLVAVILVVFLVLTHGRPAADMTLYESEFLQYQARAKVFRGRMLDYTGVCRELALPATVTCNEQETGYRVYVRHGDGTYYCGDATGFVGVVETLLQDTLRCQ